MPNIIKDKNYWKEYNKKNDRKEYMRNLMKEKRANKKLVANNPNNTSVANTEKENVSNQEQKIKVANTKLEKVLVANKTEIEKIANSELNIPVANNLNQKINLLATKINNPNVSNKINLYPKREVANNVKPKQLSEIELYNEQLYQRVKTRDPQRFYTFSDGRKIVRTKCGCNPLGDFYGWCLDTCEYFAYWRNQTIKIQNQLC